ncbi:nitrate- and nitrite sensing domain-containing protein [Lentzea sp. DG1S-22]|uniref:nitrate- and nitrite sensing domain-containing protein n=1 Tax=Lentzea sp. DG1S-22 TaxID=3108822 RepID=UPI002E7A13D7|nr:nitrate- and nitrite sensing domain-containing protein [Lentzea sp. DG1S-22]WVH78430.1 nitrate- and nitrite sensing domain-containing protein [Lentzea sp. DG1S-22]
MNVTPDSVKNDVAPGAGSGPARSAGWRLRNWRLRTKLLAVLLIPTVCALVLGGLRVRSDLQAATELNNLANQIRLETAVADLVQQLQRERDLSVSYVASNKKVDRVVLERQLRRVNDTTEAFNNKIAELSSDLNPAAVERFQVAFNQLNRLNSLRNSVRDTQYPAEAVQRTYSESIETLINLGEQTISEINDPELVRLHLTTNAIARIKEQESLKRAILLDVFQRKAFTPAQLRALQAADAELEAARNDFRKSATPDQAKIYDDTVTGLIVDTANDMQESAINQQAGRKDFTQLTSEKWDIAATLTVNLTRDVENLLVEQLQNKTDDLAGATRTQAYIASALVLAFLALALLMALFVARSILNPLRTLRRTALDVADHGLPDAVERILADPDPENAAKNAVEPVPVHTREEVGQVARAFDAVHGEAVRLAAQQALLRDNVNAMFVNLSRRSQALVERQLNLIDRLEQDEQDPDQLASLFELDHLATRMRRNSENLLVLSGTDLSRRLTRPVPAAEVLGAAVSEVEQYARVQVGQTPDVTVQGRAVNDLVHLIAELLDNATAFSDPVTKVTVRTAKTRKGELAIEIQDRGVGMGDQEIIDANDRLADPPDVDVAVSRRMGLYVVARLAKRHDIKVRLRGNEDIEGGTTALVIVPETLIAIPGQTPVSTPPSGSGSLASAFGMSPSASAPAMPSPMSPAEHTTEIGATATRASGIAGAFGGATGVQPRIDESSPSIPVSFVPSPITDTGAGATAIPVFTDPPIEDVTPSERWRRDQLAAVEPEGSFGEPTLFTAYEDRNEEAGEISFEPGYETTQFVPIPPIEDEPASSNGVSRASVDEGRLDIGMAHRNGTSEASRKKIEHDLDAPTERLPIYEAVLSQWFQAVGSETSASAAQPVPAAAEGDGRADTNGHVEPRLGGADKGSVEYIDEPVTTPPLSDGPEPELPTRTRKPVPAVAPTTTSAAGLPVRQPRAKIQKAAEEEVIAPAEQERVVEPEPVVEETPAAALTSESAWQSPADEGWHAAQALLNKTPETKTTAGLPKRTPKAQLVPGSAAPKPQSLSQTAQRPPLPPRSADAVRGRMSSLQSGVKRGRHALIEAYAGDQSSRQNEEQE